MSQITHLKEQIKRCRIALKNDRCRIRELTKKLNKFKFPNEEKKNYDSDSDSECPVLSDNDTDYESSGGRKINKKRKTKKRHSRKSNIKRKSRKRKDKNRKRRTKYRKNKKRKRKTKKTYSRKYKKQLFTDTTSNHNK